MQPLIRLSSQAPAETLTSSAVTLTVTRAPAITAQPAAVTACEGTTASFTVTATGAGLSYQWRKNGINIAGEVNPTLLLSGHHPLQRGQIMTW